jgi:putative ABC transport system permease protein
MGLLKPGATLGTVNAELAAIAERLQQRYPATEAGLTFRGLSLREATVGRDTWLILSLLAVVVGLVLLVACANIATVMLSRASARRREIAVRVALGATRGRLVRQFVAEGLLIGLASGGIGVLLAYAGLAGFRALSMDAYFQRLAINVPVLLFALALSIVAPVIFGVLPALQSSRPDMNEDLKEGGRGASVSVRGNRSHATLLVTQVAFTLAVLIVSGLVVRTARTAEQAPLGMNPDGLLVMRVRFDPPKFDDDAVRFRDVEAILARLAATPGVTAVAATATFPVTDPEPTRQFEIAGRAAASPGDAPWANEAAVYGDFLRACEIPLLEGRMWQSADRAVAWSVAVVNREAARRYWPSQSPVGAHILMLDPGGRPSGPPIEIVGVVDNVIGAEPTSPPPPRVYRPLALRPLAGVGFLVRTSSDATLMASPVREALRSADPDLAVSAIRAARTQVDAYLRSWELILALFVGFAAIGLVVAITGVYGVTAYSVGQRRHEIGVRMALGATSGSVMGLIAARTFHLIGLGAVIGLAGGWAMGLAMRGFLYGVGAGDPATYGVVIVVVTLCGLVATYVPASRVVSIDPMTVLKQD